MVNDVLSAVAVDMRPAQGGQAAAQVAAPTLAAQAAATGATGGGKTMPPGGEAAPPEPVEERPEIELPDVSRVVQNLNQFMESSRRSLNFRIDEITGRTIITVLNPETQEIVRQIPPEEFLTIARTLHRQAGMIFDAMA